MSRRHSARLATSIGLALAVPALVAAQVGATTDILSGTVRNAQGQPLAGATVTVISVETQVSRSKTTDTKGHYVIVFPDGGGRYQMTVRSIGVTPRTLLVQRTVDEDQLITNVTMGGSAAQQLSTVTVRDGTRPQGPPGGGQDRPTPGSQERAFSPDQLSKLPLADASDLALIAALTPGVVGITGSDSTGNAFSIAGQRLTDNNTTLDGLSFGASAVPQDAVRSTRVITNTFDVSRGQFSGGQVASTTRGGTNVLQGTFTEQYRDPSLAFAGGDAGAFGRAYHQNTVSGGIGGPIRKNRMFVFGSFSVRQRTDPLTSLLTANSATLQRLGVSPDSVGQFLGAIARYGIASSVTGLADDRSNDSDQLFLRLDTRLTDSHSLMLRVDGRRTDANAQRIASLGLPTSGGTQEQSGAGLMASLTSHLSAFNGAIVNELRAYRSTADNHTDPYLTLPAGRVQILSAVSDNALATGSAFSQSTLQFGGNAALPQASNNVAFESSDELSFIPAGSGHRFKVGALVNAVRNEQNFTANRLGTFTYNSLGDFLTNRPSQYTRTLTPTLRTAQSTNAALYGGDTWRVSPTVQLTYGVRLEGSRYGGAPALNPVVQSYFGYRTDRFPTEIHVSPRAGFSWSPRWNTTQGTPEQQGRLGAGGQGAQGAQGGRGAQGGGGGGRGGFGGGFGGAGGGPATVIRGGIGEFRALAPTQAFSNAQSATGLANTESQLVCIGAAVPTPDYAAYAAGTALPTECAGGAASSAITSARPNVTVIDPDFAAPRAWRGSLGITQRLKERLSLSLDLNYARGVAQYGFRDLNLDTTPQFTLPLEGGRPVFVPASTIVSATGATSLFASRLHPDLGRVLAATSSLASSTRQATLALNASTRRGVQSNLSYTIMRVARPDVVSRGVRRPGRRVDDGRQPQRVGVGAERSRAPPSAAGHRLLARRVVARSQRGRAPHVRQPLHAGRRRRHQRRRRAQRSGVRLPRVDVRHDHRERDAPPARARRAARCGSVSRTRPAESRDARRASGRGSRRSTSRRTCGRPSSSSIAASRSRCRRTTCWAASIASRTAPRICTAGARPCAPTRPCSRCAASTPRGRRTSTRSTSASARRAARRTRSACRSRSRCRRASPSAPTRSATACAACSAAGARRPPPPRRSTG